MEKNIMVYNYFDYWVSTGNKRGLDKLPLQEANRRFESGEVFYILVGDEKKPSHIITNLGKDVMTIQTLDNNLENILELEYEIMENINQNKLFLVRYRERIYNNENKQIRSITTGFATLDYNDGHHIYKILDYPIYEEFDNLTELQKSGKINYSVEEKLLWRDYPKFGEWDFMVEDSLAFKELIDKDKF